MKANLYLQGNYLATIDVPGDSLLALLAKGIITQANDKATALARELTDLDGVQCSISLRIHGKPIYIPDTER